MSDLNVIDPSTSPTSTPAADPIPSATPAPATSGAFAQPATPATPSDDRSNWVPPHRIRETRESALREAQTQFAQKEAQYQAQMQQIQSQLHALVGVQPPQNPEIDAVKKQFGQLFPGVSKLEDVADKIQALLERSGDYDAQIQHHWSTYGQNTMDKLYSKASSDLGAPLNDEGKRWLFNAFVGYVQSSPEIADRYAKDPTLVDEFWKGLSSNFIDPSRRAATATVAGRAAAGANLPQDTPSGAPRMSPAPQMQNLDERAAAAWTQYQQTNNQR